MFLNMYPLDDFIGVYRIPPLHYSSDIHLWSRVYTPHILSVTQKIHHRGRILSVVYNLSWHVPRLNVIFLVTCESENEGPLVSNFEDRKTPERKVQWMDFFSHPPLLTVRKLPQILQLQDRASLSFFHPSKTSRLLKLRKNRKPLLLS